MTDERRALLLGIAAVLALLRFGIVPWVEAQAAARERLQVLTQRLDRSVGVVRNSEAILSAREQLRVAADAARKRFPDVPSVEGFRLEGQRRIGAVVSGVGLQVALFDWLRVLTSDDLAPASDRAAGAGVLARIRWWRACRMAAVFRGG